MSSHRRTKASLFLHVHPERVVEGTLHPWATVGLGVVAMVLLAVLLVTGLALMLWYVPHPVDGYVRLVDISAGARPYAELMRDVHRVASDALVVVVGLHLLRVFLTGAMGAGRRLNWLVGLALLLIVTATAFTGFLLPWDQSAYWAATVGGELVGLLPAGEWLRGLLWGGEEVGADTLVRAYAYHVAILPTVGTLLVAYHLWRIRKAGGLARPPSEGAPTYVATRPAVTTRELTLALFTSAALLVAAMLWDAPLGPPGYPPTPVDPAKAPWFLLWVQELVSYSTTLGIVVPTALFVALAGAPVFERRLDHAGRWLPSGRRGRCAALVLAALAVLVLTVVAAFYRGPGWRFIG